jgi:thiol:disulfide interchange protein DsbG
VLRAKVLYNLEQPEDFLLKSVLKRISILNFRKAILPAVLVGLFSHVAFADNDPAVVKSAQAIFDKLGNGQAHITKSFDGPAGSDLTGLAVSLGGQRNMVAYATKDGKYIIVGAVFGADGENYSLKASQEYLPPPPPPPSAKANFDALGQTHTYLWGKPGAKKELWAVLDPDCIFCHKFYVEAEPFVKSGEVKIHVVQTGFLKPDSLGKAAAILGAKNQVDMYIKDEANFNDATEDGGIKPDMSNAKAVAQVKENNAWMQSHGIGGTPYILYRGKNGDPQVMPGFPQDINGLLALVHDGDVKDAKPAQAASKSAAAVSKDK